MVTQDHISLGKQVDAVICALRSAFAMSISLPIAWMCLHPTIDAFKAHKGAKVEKGTQTVVALQKALKRPVLTPILNVVFQIFSFCGEQDFYLLVLPLLIWNFDRVLGRQLTLLVCGGLMGGNIMKDVFELPRPKSPPVWRPGNNMDSTRLGDFGFPSTHSMNGLTNAVYVFLYLLGATPATLGLAFLQNAFAEPTTQVYFAVACVYVLMMCVSRLYLGAHTPTDIRGGVCLGVAWVSFYFAVAGVVDVWYLTTPFIFAKVFAVNVAALIINPQPEPSTPTFMQNALICGLIIGTVMGSRHYHDSAESLTAAAAAEFDAHPRVVGAVRTILGYAIVIALRVIVKSSMIALLNAMKIAHQRERVDIVGAASIKVTVYAVLAWAITFLVPAVHCWLGLASYIPEDLGKLA